jgi:hypothetical protein
MALRTPPSWLQNGSHPAENDRLTMQALVSSTGVIGSSSLQITAQGSPNMTVNASSGWGSVLSSTANAGVYLFYNDASTTLTISAADATNPRIDRIVVTVNDTYYSGSLNNVTFTVIAGTPAGSPTAPATPSNSISLATIAVAANTTTITSGNITDTRSLTTSNLTTGVYLPLGGGTMTGQLTAVGGSASITPIKLTAGATLNATLVPGAIEYDGTAQYFAPNSASTLTTNGGRAVVPATHYYALSADRSLSVSTSAQSVFGVGISLAASTTYEFEINIRFQYNVTTPSISTTLGLLLGASVTSITAIYEIANGSFGNGINPSTYSISGTASQTLNYATGSSGTQNHTIRVRGLLRTNTTTTLTPQITQGSSTYTSPLVLANSWMKLTPISNSTTTSVGAWA